MLFRYILFLLFFIIREISTTEYDVHVADYYKMPPLFGLDDYESCLSEENSKYCLVQLDLHADEKNELIQFIKEYSKYSTKHYNHTRIDRGVCITKTCKHYTTKPENGKDLEYILEACLSENIFQEYGLQAKLSTVYSCEGSEKLTERDTADLIVQGIFIIIFLVNVVASLYDIFREKNVEAVHSYLLSFSIIQNWKFLVKTEHDKQDPRIESFQFFNGVRSISSLLMIFAHTMWIFSNGYIDNTIEFEQASKKIQYQLIFNGMLMVQIFFVMSGFFLSYNLMFEAEKRKMTWDLVPKTFIYRFLRLAPSYILMLVFTMTLFRLMGSGPLWNIFVVGIVNDCRRYWWAHLLFINNYIPEDKFCAIQSWHLAADTQVFLLGLLFHFATMRRCRIKWMAIVIIFSSIAPALQVWWQDLDGIVILKPEFYRTMENATFSYLHKMGHNNITGFFIGMSTGYFIYDIQEKRINYTKNRILNYMQRAVIPCIIMVFQSGQLFNQEERKSLPLRMVYAGLLRAVLGMLIAFGYVGSVMKFEDEFRSILEWRGWTVMSKLCYSVYLTNINLIYFIMGTRTQLSHFSFFNLCLYNLGVTSMSITMAVPLYLMVEAPCNKLFKTLFFGSNTQKKKIL